MSGWAKPGVKCVCIDPVDELVRGETYTISKIDDGLLHLQELAPYRAWFARRFRALITKTQEEDVTMFNKLLDKLPEHV